MRKIKKKLFMLLLAIGIVSFSFTNGYDSHSDETQASLSIKNLKILEASAMTRYCDETSQSTCTDRHYFKDGTCVVIRGLGSLHF